MIHPTVDIHTYLKPGVRVHLAGIGGVSMCPLAEVLRGMGLTVQGSDMSESDTVQHSAHQAGTVLLHTGRGSQPSRFAAGYFLHHLLFRNLQARKHSVYGASYHRSVGLPEDGDPENPAETVHSCSNIWLNSGNDLETQSSSSMTSGESAASEATFRAISIRWS